jgi:hypothetical protein
MVSDLVDDDSDVRVNRKMELVKVGENDGGNAMIGISYLLEEDALLVRRAVRLGHDDPEPLARHADAVVEGSVCPVFAFYEALYAGFVNVAVLVLHH